MVVLLVVLVAGIGLVALIVGTLMIAEGLRELVRELPRHRGGAELPPVLADRRRAGSRW